MRRLRPWRGSKSRSPGGRGAPIQGRRESLRTMHSCLVRKSGPALHGRAFAAVRRTPGGLTGAIQAADTLDGGPPPPRTPAFRASVWVVAVFLVVAACASPSPVPQDNYYRLTVPPPEPGPVVLEGVVEVERFTADRVIAGRPIVYSGRAAPHEVREYHYHFWVEPPAALLRNELVDYLRAAGAAEAVVTPEMRLRSDYVISGRVRRLERVVGDDPGTLLELQLSVLRRGDEALLLLETYRVESRDAPESVSAAVLSLNRALTEIFARFVDDLSG